MNLFKKLFNKLFGKAEQEVEDIELYAHQDFYAFEEVVEKELVYLRASLGELDGEAEELWQEVETLIHRIKKK